MSYVALNEYRSLPTASHHHYLTFFTLRGYALRTYCASSMHPQTAKVNIYQLFKYTKSVLNSVISLVQINICCCYIKIPVQLTCGQIRENQCLKPQAPPVDISSVRRRQWMINLRLSSKVYLQNVSTSPRNAFA